MAERLWRRLGLPIHTIPADWGAHGRAAGPVRNQDMVDLAVSLRDGGATVHVAAFFDLCRRPGCPQAGSEQLAPGKAGHFSHGTAHCRAQALRAGLDVLTAVASR